MQGIKDIEAARQLIEMQIKDIDNIRNKVPYGLEYTFWEDFTARIIDRIFGNGSEERQAFEQAGRDGCFSVFESYSDRQRREDFAEILRCKKEYLEVLKKTLGRHAADQDKPDREDSPDEIHEISGGSNDGVATGSALSPLDSALENILAGLNSRELRLQAGQKFKALRVELHKPSPSWVVIKSLLAWLPELGREEYFTVLSHIVPYRPRIVD
ncbi:MAG: hypothetical protein ACYC0Q_06990 [Eubacteriales bacterium]